MSTQDNSHKRKGTPSRRALLTFATVSQALEQSNDFLLGIAPLFGSLAEESAGDIFEEKKFAANVKAKFGLVIPEDVASFLAPRLLKAGLLEARDIGSGEKALFWVPPAGHADIRDVDIRLNNIVQLFSEFVGNLDAVVVRTYTDEELEEMLYDFLLRQDKLLTSAQAALIGGSVSTDVNFTSESEYVSARFIQHLASAEPELFDFLSDIANAVLISEVVLDLGSEKPARVANQHPQVYIDAPLMMDLLGLSGPQRKSYAEQMLHGLRSIGANVSIFDHSADEIRDNLHAVLGNQPQQRHGPTADALRRREVDEAYVSFVMQNTEHVVSETGVSIFENPLSTLNVSQKAFFSQIDEKELFHLLQPHYANDKARDRDILSLQIVISRRQAVRTSNLFAARHLLLTHNQILSVTSRKFMRENKGYLFEHVPPAVHISTLFAALWLELGAQERIEISRRKLIVACAEAVRIKPELISRMKDTLAKIVPDKAAQFEVMMSQPRFMQMAQDATLGQEIYLTEDKALEAFDKLDKHLQGEAERKIKAEGTKKRENHTAEITERDQRILSLEESIKRERERRDATVESIVGRKVWWLRLWARLAAVGFLSIGIIGLVLSYYMPDDTYGHITGFIISALFLIVAFFEYTYTVIFKQVSKYGERRIRRSLRRLGYDQEEVRLVLDPLTGDLVLKAIPPDFELTPS